MMPLSAPSAFQPSLTAPACIGVFDSGVGGLSVLRALHQQLPAAPLLYVADSAHAPYGERSDAFVIERSQHVAQHLLAEGAVGIVIACNTATAAAAQQLRARWPDVPIVGVEPGLKPAVAASRSGRIGVLATPGTLASEKFRKLLHAQPAGVSVLSRPCPGLADLIEQGDLDAPSLRAAIDEHCAALKSAEVDTVVLGCTHYAFVREQIEIAMGPRVQIIDTAEAVARQAVRVLAPLLGEAAAATTRLQTSGDAKRLSDIARAWLAFPCSVEGVVPGTGIEPVRPLSGSGGF